MKSTLTAIAFCIFTLSLCAQVPQGLKYQAIARDASGQVLSEQNISVRIGILAGNTSGKLEYREQHAVVSNKYGLFDLVIGKGKPDTGTFSEIGWETNEHFVSIQIDPKGGSDFILMGTSQLLSVPYALHAKTVEIDKIDDADHDPANEIQVLSLTDNNLQLSKGGGSVALPSSTTSLWKQSFSNIYYNSGYVGIGTSSPTSVLTLDGGIGNSEIRMFNTSTGSRQTLDGLSVGIAPTSFDAWFWNRENGKLMFGTNNTERMTITADGKVGIGTNSPTTNLEIKGNVKVAGNITTESGLTIGSATIKRIGYAFGITEGGGADYISYPEGTISTNICILTFEVHFNPVVGVDSEPASFRGIKDGIWYELTQSNIIIHYPDKSQYNIEPWRMTFLVLE